jgi:fermentation-respiration switch protein FrsA (DUF1100 family)
MRSIHWPAVLGVAETLAATYLVALLVDSDVPPGLIAVRVAVVAAIATTLVWQTVTRPRAGGGAQIARIRHEMAGGLPAVVLGSTALAARAAAGVPGLVLAGPSLGALAGLAAAVAGLCVFLAGGRWLLWPMPRWWRLSGIPGAFVVAQFWLLPVIAAVLATHAPQPAFDAVAPAGAERVAFAAADGTSLVGWYSPSRNGATVVVLAGAGGTKADTRGQTDALTRNGFGVLAMDPRGSGESGGHPMLYGWGGGYDLRDAVTYLVSRTDVDPDRIAALGLSRGGEVAISGAAADPSIKAVVAEGATARTCADQTFLPGGVGGAIHHFDSCLGWELAGLLTGAPQPAPLVDELRAVGSRPVLLIAADTPEEHAATEAFRSVSPATISLWQPPGASHTGALSKYPQEWERRVVEFLSAALLA